MENNKDIVDNEEMFIKKFCRWLRSEFIIDSDINIEIE